MKCVSVAVVLAVVSLAPVAGAQSVQSFVLQKGQAIRITPEGKVGVFARMQGNTGHVAEMEHRAHPVTKGLGIWVGDDGKLRYLIDPVEGAAGFGHSNN